MNEQKEEGAKARGWEESGGEEEGGEEEKRGCKIRRKGEVSEAEGRGGRRGRTRSVG